MNTNYGRWGLAPSGYYYVPCPPSRPRLRVGGAGQLLAIRGIEKTSNAFRSKLIDVAARLSTDPNYISAVMASESGYNPTAKNPNGGATGLIQFMPATAKRLGTTTAALAGMSAVQQLDYVEKYYRPFAGRMQSPEDAYMATFMPAYVGAGPDNVISSAGEAVYEANKGFDHDGKGYITNGDVGSVVVGLIAAAEDRPPIDVTDEPEGGSTFVKVGLALGLGAIAARYLVR